MSSTEIFRKHFGEDSGCVNLNHPNVEKFFDELNKECLKEDGRTWCVKEHLFFSVTQPTVAENCIFGILNYSIKMSGLYIQMVECIINSN